MHTDNLGAIALQEFTLLTTVLKTIACINHMISCAGWAPVRGKPTIRHEWRAITIQQGVVHYINISDILI
jgi:hypothetical protein